MRRLLVVSALVMPLTLALRPSASARVRPRTARSAADVDESALSPRSPLAPMVLNGGTEPAFTSDLNGNKAAGTYHCARCLAPLFASDAKYDSGTGWPSFWRPAEPAAVELEGGGFLSSFFGRECHCAACGGHLGHRFDDGPIQTTGKRFCINGAALRFADAAAPAPIADPRDWPDE